MQWATEGGDGTVDFSVTADSKQVPLRLSPEKTIEPHGGLRNLPHTPENKSARIHPCSPGPPRPLPEARTCTQWAVLPHCQRQGADKELPTGCTAHLRAEGKRV